MNWETVATRSGFFNRYDFSSEWLKGAYIGGGYRHQSKVFVGVDADNRSLYGNSFWYADAVAGYSRRLGKNRRIGFQLNVRNVFDKRDPLVTRYTPDHVDSFQTRDSGSA